VRQWIVVGAASLGLGCHWADEALGAWRERQLNAALDRAAEEVRVVRGPLDLPKLRLVTRDELGAELLGGEEPPWAERLERFEASLGLSLPRQRRMELVQGRIAAYYVPKDDEIVVVTPWRDDVIGRVTLRHELAHARQDQVSSLLDELPADLDRASVMRLLAEGEASLVALAAQHGTDPEKVRPHTFRRPPSFEGSDAERWALQLAAGPYHRGVGGLWHHFEQDGWTTIDALLTAPPEQSHRVMFPTEYYREPRPIPPPTDLPAGAAVHDAFEVGAFLIERLLVVAGHDAPVARYWFADRFVPFEVDGEPGYHWTIRTASSYEAGLVAELLADGVPGGRPARVVVEDRDLIVRTIQD